MKFVVESMKLEVIVKADDGTVLSHEALEKDNSSLKRDKIKKEVQTANEIVDQSSLYSKDDTATPTTNSKPKEKSFLSRLMWWRSKKKSSDLNREMPETTKHAETSDVKALIEPQPLISKNLENVDSGSNAYLSADSTEALDSDTQPVDNNKNDSFSMEQKSTLQTRSSEHIDQPDTHHHLDVMPMKLTEYVNNSDNESAAHSPDDEATNIDLNPIASPSEQNVGDVLNDINFTSSKTSTPDEKEAENSVVHVTNIYLEARAKFSMR